MFLHDPILEYASWDHKLTAQVDFAELFEKELPGRVVHVWMEYHEVITQHTTGDERFGNRDTWIMATILSVIFTQSCPGVDCAITE